MIFEFTNKRGSTQKPLKVLVIGSTYRAYEQEDGSVLLNDENQGYSFYPDESYADFSSRLLTQQHFMYQ